ncbi:10354_t:CDS:2 [Rhizophagus irregularis]|nr:10354_t:CDS:2 [Rhizophagus irregularis]
MFYVFLLQFFVISFSLTILVESATNARYAHVSALINDQLFIIGGQPTSFQLKGSNDVFYLDLKKSFNLQDPSLVDITRTSGMPLTISWASSTVVNKDGILIYGGYTWSLNSGNLDNGDNALYLFNATTKQWTIPTVSGAPPPKRREMKIVSDNNENIFIYGGIQLGENPQWYTDMNILDAQSEFRWELIQMKNSPTYPRADYTATMLPNGVIVYIGGRTRAVRDASILETELNIKQETSGELIDNRNSHSAVLTPDGKIIIYGGAQGPNLITASPSLAILDTSTSVYTWSVPTISSQFSPPPLILHTADLYGDYMIVAFGNVTNGATSPVEINSGIYMLDTKTFSWITSYTPNSTSPSDKNDPISIGIIIGIVCAIIVFLVVASIIGWIFYKRYRENNNIEHAIPTPGNVTVISHSRPTSTYKSTSNYGSTPYVPSYTPPPYYTPHGGFTPKNPPYSTRN